MGRCHGRNGLGFKSCLTSVLSSGYNGGRSLQFIDRLRSLFMVIKYLITFGVFLRIWCCIYVFKYDFTIFLCIVEFWVCVGISFVVIGFTRCLYDIWSYHGIFTRMGEILMDSEDEQGVYRYSIQKILLLVFQPPISNLQSLSLSL